MNHTPVVIITDEIIVAKHLAADCIATSVGLNDTIIVMHWDDYDNDYEPQAIFRTNNLPFTGERNSVAPFYWWFIGDSFVIVELGQDQRTITPEEFLAWIKENHPEDLRFLLFHPEVLSGTFNKD